ncbi:hypothetical protein V6N12_051904 [Hibiscus sabdariffa]|uniref:Leucine-rich repeat-containing N-terminal plant-type domain-containing protein n=1 Tax=Hibiscus sabdariffa TaxID=183260 RepID=A0ABR2GHY8_9ROSI
MEIKWFWIVILAVAVAVAVGLMETEGCLEQERVALLHLKSFFNSPSALWDWVDVKGSHCCQWERVQCSNTSRRVIQLSLNSARLHRYAVYLNASLFLPFEELKSLSLVDNEIAGFVDNEGLLPLKELDLSYNLLQNSTFAFISRLSNLKSLSIAGNNLQGCIDIKEMNKLAKLKHLDLSDNQIESLQSFEELENASTNVQEIYMSDSHLSNNILQSIGALTSLRRLTLQNSSLSGPLPSKGWCDLWNLELLDLSRNALEGSIPSCFSNLTSLQLLDLSNNHIKVPSSFISFANNSFLKYLFVDQIHLVSESTLQIRTKHSEFQLQVLCMSNYKTKGSSKELPNFLYYQYDLRYLDLSNNNFGGQTPTWLLENNTRLQQFLMSGNSFKGPLQSPKHANVNMFEVDMSNNEMQGQVPMNICSTFPQLEYFSLSRNAFEGTIPPCFGGLKSLSLLDLSSNNFSRGILEELAKSNSLQTLRLSNNNLSGKIPTSILISNIDGLYLDGNNFHGEIPKIDLSAIPFSSFRDIDLRNNHLSGKIPRWIWNVSSLETLDLSNNHFDGHIPRELCNLGSLIFLDLSKNKFSGSVPSCICSLAIEHLHLSKNRLSGPLPRALYRSSSLVTLDLNQNNFTGKIPDWIDTLSSLTILLLKANQFEGKIPSQICRLNSLSIIDLSQNKFFGPIPSCLSNFSLEPTFEKSFPNAWSLPGIRVLEDAEHADSTIHWYPYSYVEEQVAFTTKKGLHTYSGNILDYMSGIDLSCNRLTGQIPFEIGNLSELHALNLSHNYLTGFIPPSFSKLKQIESLDLSYNKLSGIIPIQMMELNSLAVFNVSYNNFSGNIPHEKAQFATFDESSYLGNPLLCGPPKHESCTGTGSIPKSPNASDSEEESGWLDMHAFYLTFCVCYIIVLMTIGAVLYINPHWRRAWFYFIQHCIDTCYYFIVDNIIGVSLFRRSP